MAHVVYIGDEVTAAGFRLAGLDTRVTGPGDAGEALRHAVAEGCDCVLLAGALASYLPEALLLERMQATAPLFALVPGIDGTGAPAPVAREVRAALGIDS
jgi:vacuolar-type H+-ATPase subunit F/Vma7